MSFAYPYLLAVPVLFLAVLFLKRKKSSGVFHPQTDLLKKAPTSLKIRLRKPILTVLYCSFVVLLGIAAARPQHVTVIDEDYKSRNLILALDVSGSMKERDFKSSRRYISRLEAVKMVVSEFIDSRLGDRIGLVVFGTNAYLQSPLTLDHTLLKELIGLLQVGVAGDGTAIGDGLGVSLKRLKDIRGASRAIILLTDGANNSGRVNPLQAAKVAKNLGIKIHTIGIGGKQRQHMAQSFFFGRGQVEYDEKTLRSIADLSGGVFFNAENLEGLKRVYKEIDDLEKTSRNDPQKRIVEELFADFALGALLCLLAYTVLVNSVFMKLP